MKIAVSGCLLGEKVRFDGVHKHDRFVTDELGCYASFVPFCPEAIAFGIPRPSVKLVNRDDNIAVVSNKDGSDLTQKLLEKSYEEVHRIADEKLGGIIFKSRSPSCGLGSTVAYLENGFAGSKTDGVFASVCREKFPLLPMEEEGRLQDAWLRENFIMQLFAYDAIEKLKENKPTMKILVDFHIRNKFLLQAKDEKLYRVLGNIVGNHENLTFGTLFANYEQNFKVAIAQKSSIKRNRNVLEHMSGFFKNELSGVEKKALHEQIEEYAKKIVPIIVPLSTIKLYAKKHKIAYLLGQTFLEPYPKELALRSSLLSSK
ncbi:DUF523 and DUF1722 domain-containing protein [Sulfurimonas sp.]|uniref:YbgA family protein n=1 Tax=Sulfurimonas sp. TaxID=2022749 RepID=UPI001A0A7C7F|nr:DUF523 and DUF1722 domain-containing protein [Sulfurimonas sp.]MBE0514680.1 DUF523 and DUF1722 domain-containing protein [Sulfurimonas sp.]